MNLQLQNLRFLNDSSKKEIIYKTRLNYDYVTRVVFWKIINCSQSLSYVQYQGLILLTSLQ
jgi:hypothetical protein